MKCPSCGADLAPGTSPCPECGAETSDLTVVYVPVHEGVHPSLTGEEAEDVAGIEGFALVVERGPRAGTTFVLQSGNTTVGRHPDSDIFLDDITVSRHHCRFAVDAEGLKVEDSGSTNGTYVAGERVNKTRLLAGDEVIVGKFHLLVVTGSD